jgi:hypothetical protein
MYFGENLIKEKTKWEIVWFVTKASGKACRPHMHLSKESQIHRSVYNNILRN